MRKVFYTDLTMSTGYNSLLLVGQWRTLPPHPGGRTLPLEGGLLLPGSQPLMQGTPPPPPPPTGCQKVRAGPHLLGAQLLLQRPPFALLPGVEVGARGRGGGRGGGRAGRWRLGGRQAFAIVIVSCLAFLHQRPVFKVPPPGPPPRPRVPPRPGAATVSGGVRGCGLGWRGVARGGGVEPLV